MLWNRWQRSGEPSALALCALAIFSALVGGIVGCLLGMRKARKRASEGKAYPMLMPVASTVFGVSAASFMGMPAIFTALGSFSIFLDHTSKAPASSGVAAVAGMLFVLQLSPFAEALDHAPPQPRPSPGSFSLLFFTVTGAMFGILGLITFIRSGAWIGLATAVFFGGGAAFMFWSWRREQRQHRRPGT